MAEKLKQLCLPYMLVHILEEGSRSASNHFYQPFKKRNKSRSDSFSKCLKNIFSQISFHLYFSQIENKSSYVMCSRELN